MYRFRLIILVAVLALLLLIVWLNDVRGPAFPYSQLGGQLVGLVLYAVFVAPVIAIMYFFVRRIRNWWRGDGKDL
jgi:uncharacterized membrane protein